MKRRELIRRLEDSEGISGFGELDRVSGEIRAVYVHPRVLRTGVGSALLAALEDAAREAGLSHLHLSASLNAVPFYERAGYRVERRSTFRFTPEVSIACAEMRKALAWFVKRPQQ